MLDKLSGYVVLRDRKIAGSKTNIDHLAIGFGGVLVIETKNSDVVTLADPTDRSDDSNDISRVRHRHHRSDHRLLRHVIWFDGQQAEPTELQLLLRYWHGNAVQRLHVVVRRERGALATEVLDEEEQRVGGGRAWMDVDGSRLVMQFRRRVFDGASRYRWKAESLLGIGEFDQPCDDEDTGPPVCLDLAPARGWIEHRFQ